MCAQYTWVREAAALLGVVLMLVMSKPSLADEGGAGMYLPGTFGSLSAVPGEPGWSLALAYYQQKASSGIPLVGYASERADLGYGVPIYTLETPVLGGQLALSMAGATGKDSGYDRQRRRRPPVWVQ